jgi:hypothetical protein
MAGPTPNSLDNSPGSGGTNSQGLTDWSAPYITDYLGKAKALAGTDYQTYKGPLTAGSSDLQNKAFQGIGSLAVPGAIGDAAAAAGKAGTNMAGMSYSPNKFGNQFQAPGAYQPTTSTNQYNAPTAYQPTTYTNQYNAPTAYQATDFTSQYKGPADYQTSNIANQYQAPSSYQTSNFSNQYQAPQNYNSVGSAFDSAQAQQYMNPYLQASLNPQLDEARRQAQITQAQNAAKMSSAGAFGGGRQAIMDTENQRNLGTNLANITGQGYNTAFSQAQNQFNAEQARKIQEAQYGAQQGMTAAQLQAQFGLSAQQANEASRQFGAQQGMTAAQLQAQYGLSSAQANEMSRQFGAGQKMTASQLAAQFGLSADQAKEASKQFGAQQGMTAAQLAAQYGLSGEQATEASKQFATNQGMTAAQLQAQFGLSADQANEMSRQFGAQQKMTASQLAAQFGLSSDQATEASKQFGTNFGLSAQNAALAAAQAQGNLGALQNQTTLANLNAQLSGGATQRGVEAEGTAADLAEFEKQRQFPYQQLQFQRDMITGLPTSSVTNTPAQMSDMGNLLSVLGGGSKVAESLGYKDVGSLLKKLGIDLGP